MPIQPILTKEDVEWQEWKQFKAEQYKHEQELKEFNEWKRNGKPKIVVKAVQPPPHKVRVAFNSGSPRFAF